MGAVGDALRRRPTGRSRAVDQAGPGRGRRPEAPATPTAGPPRTILVCLRSIALQKSGATSTVASAGDRTPVPDCPVVGWARVIARKRLFIEARCLGKKSYAEAMPAGRILPNLGEAARPRAHEWCQSDHGVSGKGSMMKVINPGHTLRSSSRSPSSREMWAAGTNGDRGRSDLAAPMGTPREPPSRPQSQARTPQAVGQRFAARGNGR